MNLDRRLALLGWTPQSTARIRAFRPIFETHIDRIIRCLYDHLLRHPESARLLAGLDITRHLVPAQRAHWLKLFECAFDDVYVRNALRIGQVHYQHQVPPYVYIASYNYFLGNILAASAEATRWFDLPDLLADISRLVSLDMELSLSAYVRQHWKNDDHAQVVVVD